MNVGNFFFHHPLLQIEASDHFLSSFFIAILIEWSIGIIFSINIFGIAVLQKKFAAKSFFKVLERKFFLKFQVTKLDLLSSLHSMLTLMAITTLYTTIHMASLIGITSTIRLFGIALMVPNLMPKAKHVHMAQQESNS